MYYPKPEHRPVGDSRYAYRHNVVLADRVLCDIFTKKNVLPMSTAGVDSLGKKLSYAIGKSRRWRRNRWEYQLVYDENLGSRFVGWPGISEINTRNFYFKKV